MSANLESDSIDGLNVVGTRETITINAGVVGNSQSLITILPLSENAFTREPLACIAEEDYSHFDARYGVTEATADPEALRHSQWLISVYGKPPKTEDQGITNAKRLLTEQREFQDSRDSLGLQLCDMLVAILRRALNDRLNSTAGRTLGAC